tara:strand:+ start:1170 stop:1949 length:780 start_codon:yes stop_codon:yes gene_type:complete
MIQANFIMALRSEEAKFLDTHPMENHLLNIIARRARRTKCSLTGLDIGECFLGHKGVGMTEQQYRTAKKNLKKWNFVEFKKGQRVTDRGTVARLLDMRVYDINETKPNGSLTEGQRKANGSLTTNNNDNKDNNVIQKNAAPSWRDQYMITFWKAYPKKVDKKQALERLKRMIKAKPDQEFFGMILDRINQKALVTEKQFWASPDRYLKDELWEDEIIENKTESKLQNNWGHLAPPSNDQLLGGTSNYALITNQQDEIIL